MYPKADKVQVLWTYANVDRLDEAVENLRERECAGADLVGFLSTIENRSRCQVVPEILDEIRYWTVKKNLDGAVWTDLPSNFREATGKEFNESNVIEFLSGLQGKERERARRYIEKAPPQIMTRMRRKIERELGWEHEGSNR